MPYSILTGPVPAKIWTDINSVESEALTQIRQITKLPWSCSDLELKKANQQPRSAYKCEPCKVSVSGKPEQLIKCGNCGNDLLELVKVPNGI